MKFIHLSDCHLADNYSFNLGLSNQIRINNQKSFYNILSENTDVDFVLIAGDLYERNYFTLTDYEQLFDKIGDFAKDVFYVAGNHDYIDNYNLKIFERKPDNLHIFSSEDFEFFEIDNVRVYGISYDDRSFKKEFPYDLRLDHNYYNILLIHGEVNNPSSPYLNLELSKLKIMGFSYVALGHIHKREDFGQNIYYSGSIEPHDYSDIYDYGYIRNNDGEIKYINSSLIKFYDIKVDADKFNDNKEIIEYLENKLEDRINIVRLEINRDISKKYFYNNLDIYDLNLKIKRTNEYEDLVKLFPNSLLEKFKEKLDNGTSKIEKRALELGLDAIYRSKDE